MTLQRDDRGNRRRPPRHWWTIPLIVVAAIAVLGFVAVVLVMSGQSLF